MRKTHIITALIALGATLYAAPSHKQGDKKQNEAASSRPNVMPESQDELLFLVPHLHTGKQEVIGKRVLDIGCGTGAWAVTLAKSGAEVCAFDAYQQNIERAQAAAAFAGIGHKISWMEGSSGDLPYQDGSFDTVMSMRLVSGELVSVGLEQPMKEIARVLKKGGEATVVIPASYDIVFTDGQRSEQEVMHSIQKQLEKCAKQPTQDVITAVIEKMQGIHRATFVVRDDRLQLVTSQMTLQKGESIWRKEGQLVQPAVYHTEEDYLIAFQQAGLLCTEVKRPCFFGNVKYRMYRDEQAKNAQLGTEYVHNNPFTIFVIKRSA